MLHSSLLLISCLFASKAPACTETASKASERHCICTMCATDSIKAVAADSSHTNASKMKQIKQKVKRTGSVIYRFIKSFDDYDTTYIAPNYYIYTVMLQNTNYFQSYSLQGRSDDGIVQSIHTKPDPSVKLGPYFGWRWIFLGYTFDVSHPRAAGKVSELSFRLYSSMLGLDFIHLRNDGGYHLGRTAGFEGIEPHAFRGTAFSGMNSQTTSASAYYVFNHKHFSYPATFNQSTVQRKSSGSAMMGIGYSRQKVSFDYTRLPEALIGTPNNERIIEELKFSNVNYDYYYLSGGYAYNWVFARNWCVGASVMPSLGIRKAKGEKLRGNELLMDLKNFSFDCTSRFGLVWNNTNWFAGASFISHLYAYRKNRLSMTNSINYANIYLGFFFHRKRQYR